MCFKSRVKLLAGLTRAALNTRATIIDSGLFTGMEKFCTRKSTIKLILIIKKFQILTSRYQSDWNCAKGKN